MLSHRFQERIVCLLIWPGVGLIHFHSPVAIISDSLWNLLAITVVFV